VAQGHDLVHFGNILIAGGVQDEHLSVPCHLEAAVVFFFDRGDFTEKSVNIAPLQIVRDGVLEDALEGALVRAGERCVCFHKGECSRQSGYAGVLK